ncbi:disease resistance protein [Musa troglodytarum]|uniref:Disease resistance protein n=5 Tax=Musa troglodytarum TaxID=320322 RepID=A0A9E7HQK1_9LILI|nr:disease resistance protein [Musa troglodytarum]
MAEVVLFSLIEKMTTAVATAAVRPRGCGARSQHNVHEGMIRIKSKLEEMQEFVKSMSTYRSEHETVFVSWAKQVQDVAFDIEDIVDEYTYVVAGGSWGGWGAFVCGLFNDAKATALREIARRLEAIEVSLAQLSGMEELPVIRILQRMPELPGEPQRGYHLAESAHIIEEDELVGIDDHKDRLIGLLTDEEPRRTAVAVFGMGGAGKTTLVTRVYRDGAIVSHFSCRAWVFVSPSYNVNDLLRKILRALLQERIEEVTDDFDSMEYRNLVEALRSHLDRQRYLIVLDDVWQVSIWTDISYALIANSCRSRIVITTRMQEVASVAGGSRVMRVDPLPEEMAWALFCKKAFPREEGSVCPPALEHWARRIVDKCEGLPLAIVAIGILLSYRDRAESTWKSMHDGLTWSTTEHTGLHRVSRILSLSIRHLPYHLRNCLLYCSLFPDGYLIGRNRLIRLWVAEGFVKERRERSMEEVAEDYLNQLVGRCLLQVTHRNESGRVRFCRVHDLIRELIVARSREEHFAEAYDGEPEDLSDRIRRLSLLQGAGADERLSEKMPLLRSFLAFSSSSTSLLSKCRLIRVLDLYTAPLESLPDEIGHLFDLRYLSIRRTNVRHLPKTLGSLQKLETLDAVYTHIEELPSGVTRLESLRHLMVKKFHRQTSRYTVLSGGVVVPGGMDKLRGLQTMKAVVVGDETTVRHLRRLTQMKSLDIRGVRTIHSKLLSASISKMDRLVRLVVMARHKDDTLLLGNLTPPPRLRKLSLYGNLEKGMTSRWPDSLRALTHLVLKMSRLKADSLSSLMELPNLVSLFLMQAYDGTELCFRAGRLRKLKSLWLYDMIHLSRMEVEENALESLRELRLVRCGKLKTIPVGIEYLGRLQKLELESMPIELVEKLQGGGQTEDDRMRLQHIPVIENWFQRDGCWMEERLS